MTFQDLILTLQQYWAKRGCILAQGYDLEVGAGTMNPATFLRVLGPEPWNVAYVEPSRRPTDGRYGENPNRLYQHHQFQVILKPNPPDVQEIYLGSLKAIGIDPRAHDIRFVEDDWESPTLGAWGLGWEVWCDGMEITQFTYFQQAGGFEMPPGRGGADLRARADRHVPAGRRERLRHRVGEGGQVPRGLPPERGGDERVHASARRIRRCSSASSTPTRRSASGCIGLKLPLPAYDYCLKCSHTFNLLDARGAISVTERAAYIGRVRALAHLCARGYLDSRETLGFPMLPQAQRKAAVEAAAAARAEREAREGKVA